MRPNVKIIEVAFETTKAALQSAFSTPASNSKGRYKAFEAVPQGLNMRRIHLRNFDYSDSDDWDDRQAILYLSVSDDSALPEQEPLMSFPGMPYTVEVDWFGRSPCSYCSKPGHLIKDCPARLKLFCTTCKIHGHIVRDCSRYGSRDRNYAMQRGQDPVRSLRVLDSPIREDVPEANQPSEDEFTREISPEVTRSEMPRPTPSFTASQEEVLAGISSMLPSAEGTPELSVLPLTQDTTFSLTTSQEASPVDDSPMGSDAGSLHSSVVSTDNRCRLSHSVIRRLSGFQPVPDRISNVIHHRSE
ncbi:hypothetical protein EDD11_007003 [Mortierella claussenii]|nr:hypothetical protein EDD11_007003 [Mortierella claussenii]